MNSADTETPLFVYGKLLEEEVRERLLGRPISGRPATLSDYERRLGRYFYIIKCDGARTPGLILDDLLAKDFEILDRFEDLPRLYTREQIDVVDEQGTSVRCWIYLPSNLLTTSFG